jgi:hypothetical protein
MTFYKGKRPSSITNRSYCGWTKVRPKCLRSNRGDVTTLKDSTFLNRGFVWLKHGGTRWVLQNAIFKKVEYFTIFQFTFKKCRNGELLYMKNLSVFILSRKILFCSIIFPHRHKRTCPSTPTASVRFVYGYRRETEESRGSWKLYMLKKGSGIFVA